MTNEPLMVTRRLVLADAEAAAGVLGATKGIALVQAEPGGRTLKVSYDLRQMRLTGIEQALAAAGVAPSRGIVAAIGRMLARFTEDNRLANASAEPHCCCKPPKGA